MSLSYSTRPNRGSSWYYHDKPQHPALQPPESSPISTLPDELWTEILSYLAWDEVLILRPVSRRFARLGLSPELHRNLTIHLPFVPKVLPQLLPHVRHLQIELLFLQEYARRPGEWAWCNSSSHLSSILQTVPDDGLLSLGMPGASEAIQWDVVGPELARIGGRLEKLNLRYSGLGGSLWVSQWGAVVGSRGRGLRELDLTGTPIISLPDLDGLQHLTKLVLQSCCMLSRRRLAELLAYLPQSLEYLDISYLRQVTQNDLYNMQVSPSLKVVKLIGIDHLTRSDVRALQQHWSEQCLPTLEYDGCLSSSPESVGPRTPTMSMGLLTPPPSPPRDWYAGGVDIGGSSEVTKSRRQRKVSIVHSALLESDDEAGYRQFIGEVASGVQLQGHNGDIVVI